jgi:hypothetical protein
MSPPGGNQRWLGSDPYLNITSNTTEDLIQTGIVRLACVVPWEAIAH